VDGSHAQQATLARKVYGRAILVVPVLWAVLFLPAGTLAYWQAWIYLAILLVPMFLVFRYLLRKHPALLERRMKMREKEVTQQRVVGLSAVYFLVAFLLPGLDKRWGWCDVPMWLVLVADLVVVLGYGLFILVLRENQFAARTVQVEEGQPVVSSGPYAVVRHPMYLGVMLMYLASPLALGSYWALLPCVLIVPVLVVRIANEEKTLERELKGYLEYEQKTRYRILPGIW